MSAKLILEILVLLGALLMVCACRRGGLRPMGCRRAARTRGGYLAFRPSRPREVLIIVLTVIMAASAMEVAGGVDFLVRVAERIIRKNPKQVTIVAPLVTYGFTFASAPATSSIRCCRHL
jgi:anaerobic C4-dicarboxylate transporter DcuA